MPPRRVRHRRSPRRQRAAPRSAATDLARSMPEHATIVTGKEAGLVRVHDVAPHSHEHITADLVGEVAGRPKRYATGIPHWNGSGDVREIVVPEFASLQARGGHPPFPLGRRRGHDYLPATVAKEVSDNRTQGLRPTERLATAGDAPQNLRRAAGVAGLENENPLRRVLGDDDGTRSAIFPRHNRRTHLPCIGGPAVARPPDVRLRPPPLLAPRWLGCADGSIG